MPRVSGSSACRPQGRSYNPAPQTGQQRAALERLQTANRELTGQLEEAKSYISKLEAKLTSGGAGLSERYARSEERLHKAGVKIGKQQEAINRLNEELGNANLNVGALRKSMHDKLEAWQRSVGADPTTISADLLEEVGQLRVSQSQIEERRLRTERERDQVVFDLQRLQQESDGVQEAAREAIEELKQERSAKEDLSEELERVSAGKVEMFAALEAQSKAQEEAMARLQALEAQLADTVKERDTFRETAGQREVLNGIQNERLGELNERVRVAEDDVADAIAEADALRKRDGELQAELNTLYRQLDEGKVAIDVLAEEKSQLESQNSSMAHTNERLSEQVSLTTSINATLNEARQANLDLQKGQESLQRQLSESTKREEEHKKRVSHLEKSLQEANQAAASARERCELAEKRVNELQSELSLYQSRGSPGSLLRAGDSSVSSTPRREDTRGRYPHQPEIIRGWDLPGGYREDTHPLNREGPPSAGSPIPVADPGIRRPPRESEAHRPSPSPSPYPSLTPPLLFDDQASTTSHGRLSNGSGSGTPGPRDLINRSKNLGRNSPYRRQSYNSGPPPPPNLASRERQHSTPSPSRALTADLQLPTPESERLVAEVRHLRSTGSQNPSKARGRVSEYFHPKEEAEEGRYSLRTDKLGSVLKDLKSKNQELSQQLERVEASAAQANGKKVKGKV